MVRTFPLLWQSLLDPIIILCFDLCHDHRLVARAWRLFLERVLEINQLFALIVVRPPKKQKASEKWHGA